MDFTREEEVAVYEREGLTCHYTVVSSGPDHQPSFRICMQTKDRLYGPVVVVDCSKKSAINKAFADLKRRVDAKQVNEDSIMKLVEAADSTLKLSENAQEISKLKDQIKLFKETSIKQAMKLVDLTNQNQVLKTKLDDLLRCDFAVQKKQYEQEIKMLHAANEELTQKVKDLHNKLIDGPVNGTKIFHLMLVDYNNKTFELDITEGELLFGSDLKECVSDCTKVPMEYFSLTVNGKVLLADTQVDLKTLVGQIVRMCPRLEGGSQHIVVNTYKGVGRPILPIRIESKNESSGENEVVYGEVVTHHHNHPNTKKEVIRANGRFYEDNLLYGNQVRQIIGERQANLDLAQKSGNFLLVESIKSEIAREQQFLQIDPMPDILQKKLEIYKIASDLYAATILESSPINVAKDTALLRCHCTLIDLNGKTRIIPVFQSQNTVIDLKYFISCAVKCPPDVFSLVHNGKLMRLEDKLSNFDFGLPIRMYGRLPGGSSHKVRKDTSKLVRDYNALKSLKKKISEKAEEKKSPTSTRTSMLKATKVKKQKRAVQRTPIQNQVLKIIAQHEKQKSKVEKLPMRRHFKSAAPVAKPKPKPLTNDVVKAFKPKAEKKKNELTAKFQQNGLVRDIGEFAKIGSVPRVQRRPMGMKEAALKLSKSIALPLTPVHIPNRGEMTATSSVALMQQFDFTLPLVANPLFPIPANDMIALCFRNPGCSHIIYDANQANKVSQYALAGVGITQDGVDEVAPAQVFAIENFTDFIGDKYYFKTPYAFPLSAYQPHGLTQFAFSSEEVPEGRFFWMDKGATFVVQFNYTYAVDDAFLFGLAGWSQNGVTEYALDEDYTPTTANGYVTITVPHSGYFAPWFMPLVVGTLENTFTVEAMFYTNTGSTFCHLTAPGFDQQYVRCNRAKVNGVGLLFSNDNNQFQADGTVVTTQCPPNTYWHDWINSSGTTYDQLTQVDFPYTGLAKNGCYNFLRPVSADDFCFKDEIVLESGDVMDSKMSLEKRGPYTATYITVNELNGQGGVFTRYANVEFVNTSQWDEKEMPGALPIAMDKAIELLSCMPAGWENPTHVNSILGGIANAGSKILSGVETYGPKVANAIGTMVKIASLF